MTEPTNVFEWCWEHSTDLTEEDRKVLLDLAFRAVDLGDRTEAHALVLAASNARINGRLITAGYIAIDGPAHAVWFPAYETARLPHTLTLSTWGGEPYDDEDAHRWDHADIECPHQPATEAMPCAMWEPCGCPPDTTEAPLDDGGDGDGRGPCSKSAIGQHRYIEGEPNRPVASCFVLGWETEIAERAFELGLMPGTHPVRPWWDGDAVQLELVEPQVVRHG